MIPCYIENIPLPDELDLSIGRIQAINCFASDVVLPEKLLKLTERIAKNVAWSEPTNEKRTRCLR